MKSIQRRFCVFKKKHADLADFTVLMKTVKGQFYNQNTISKWFRELVEKEDYSKNDKRTLMAQLIKLTNWSEEHGFKG
jgi:hypothetical protein